MNTSKEKQRDPRPASGGTVWFGLLFGCLACGLLACGPDASATSDSIDLPLPGLKADGMIQEDIDGENSPDCMPDEYETRDGHPDNNACRNATRVTSDDIACPLGVCDGFYFHATSHGPGDYDVYALDLVDRWWQSRFAFEVLLTNIPEGEDYDLYLYKGLENCEQGRPIGASFKTIHQGERIRFYGTPGVDDSGLYYVEVVPWKSQPCTDPYLLEITTL
jgi:hypothetical protein